MRTGQSNQPVRPLFQPLLAQLRAASILILQIGTRQQLAQTQITGIGLTQQQQAQRLIAVVHIGDEHIATDDGLKTRPACLFIEFNQPEHIGQIGQRQRGH
jgi:hypothetical protein